MEGLIFNAKPNQRFGLHVHEQGDLTNACKSAGAHFNPYARQVGEIGRIGQDQAMSILSMAANEASNVTGETWETLPATTWETFDSLSISQKVL